MQSTLSNQQREGIVAILPRGEAIRNFVYSGALDEAAREVGVTLLTVIPDEEYLESVGAGRFDRVIELASHPDHRLLNLLREQLDISHGRYLWSAAARERWRRREYEANTPVKKLKRATKKLLAYPFANRAGVEFLSKVEQTASRVFRSTDDELNLLRELNPSLVFNGSHVHSRNSIRVIHAARRLGVPTASFIFSWDNLTSQGRIIPPYDYYLVWNEAIRDQLLRIYPSVRSDQVFVTGTPQFDFHFRPEFFRTREEFCSKVGADPSRPIVLYTTGMDNHMPEEARVIEGVYESLRRMTQLGPPQLMVRLYPKDRRPERFDDLRRRCPEILFPHIPWISKWQTPKLEDSYLLTNMLRHSALGVNIASTVSLELAMFDKPVINVGYNPSKVAKVAKVAEVAEMAEVAEVAEMAGVANVANPADPANVAGPADPANMATGVDITPVKFAHYYDFDHYRPVVSSGAVSVAWTEDEMRGLLIEALTQPHKDSHKRRAFIQTMFGATLDGRSASRVAQTLLQLARHYSV